MNNSPKKIDVYAKLNLDQFSDSKCGAWNYTIVDTRLRGNYPFDPKFKFTLCAFAYMYLHGHCQWTIKINPPTWLKPSLMCHCGRKQHKRCLTTIMVYVVSGGFLLLLQEYNWVIEPVQDWNSAVGIITLDVLFPVNQACS